MPEELKKEVAQTKVEEVAKPDIVNDKEFVDEEKSEEVAKQTKEENAEFARIRREAERLEQISAAKQAAENEAIIFATGGVNPYTDKPIVDALDVAEFKRMKQIEKSGGDPVADYHEAVKNDLKKQAEETSNKTKTEESTRKDIADFKLKHPDVKLNELLDDKKFKLFNKYRLGQEPLSKIYADFLAFTAKEEVTDEQKELEKQARIEANKQASPGSLKTAAANEVEFYTLAQIKGMSQKEEEANHDKVLKSLAHLKIIK